jgi:hypothetical protein
MREYLVGGRWPLSLLDGAGGHFAHINRESSTWNEWCFMHIIRDLPTGKRVVEYFGGVGIFATIVQECLKPSAHVIYDLDPDCARQLAWAFAGRAAVAQGDACEFMGQTDADIVVLDFPTSNVRFFERDWPIKRLMKRKPRYLIWSDTALRRIGWHRHLYTEFHGQPVVTYDDYIRCFNVLMWKHYRYTITRVVRHMHAYYLAEPRVAMVTPEVAVIKTGQLEG